MSRARASCGAVLQVSLVALLVVAGGLVTALAIAAACNPAIRGMGLEPPIQTA